MATRSVGSLRFSNNRRSTRTISSLCFCGFYCALSNALIRYSPRKLLLFLLSNTHPEIGVMFAIRRHLIKGDENNGNKNTTRLINNTDEVMEIREFRGIITGENNFISAITVKARQHTDIDSTKCGGDDSQGGQPSCLMIFCGGSLLRSSERDLLLRGEEFIRFKTVTIDQPEDQNSSGVVNYEVKFQPRDASVSAKC